MWATVLQLLFVLAYRTPVLDRVPELQPVLHFTHVGGVAAPVLAAAVAAEEEVGKGGGGEVAYTKSKEKMGVELKFFSSIWK